MAQSSENKTSQQQYKFKEDEPDKRVISDYTVYFKKLLGSYYLIGKYGKVYEGLRNSDQLKVAVKVSMNTVAVDEKSLKELMQQREIVVMKQVKSENLIQFYDCKITINNVYLFIEYCNGGNLAEYMKNNPNLPDDRIIDIFKQISNGFRCLVEKNIIHRDLKPDNIMMHDGIVKISDFGFARFIEGDPIEKRNYTLRTPLYLPPQLFTERRYSTQFDVWSFGCILYELMYGRVLHEDVKDLGQLKIRLQNFKTQKLQVPKSDRNEALVQLVQSMLEYEESDRITWNQIFQHEINRMPAQQFLSIYQSQFEMIGNNRVQNNSFRQSISNKISNQTIFNQIIQQFDNANFPQFFIMKWTNAILVLWCFYVESILKQIELKKKIPTFLIEQEEFYKTEQAQLLTIHLRDSYKEIQNQLESFKIFLLQWIEKPSQLIGQSDNEDVRFYRMIEKSDIQGIVNVIEKNINMNNQFKKDISIRLSSILQLVKQEL